MSFDLKIENGDISIGQDGTVKIVSDNSKLRQDIIKILLTPLHENKFHQEYGNEIGSLKIGQIIDRELLELDIRASVEISIRKLMSLQREQSKRQYVSPGEVIADILDISASRDINDPRLYIISVSILTQKLTTITESVTVKII